MGELEPTRTPGERRLYALADIGTVLLKSCAGSIANSCCARRAAGASATRSPTATKRWGRRPVKITVGGPSALDPGLLLFAAFVVRGLREHASAAAGATASGA
jgi:hypothetical protein